MRGTTPQGYMLMTPSRLLIEGRVMIGGEVVQTEYVDIRRISTGLSVFDYKTHSCGIYRRSVFGHK